MKKTSLGNFKETWDRYQKYQRFLPYFVLGLIILLTISVLRSSWKKIDRFKEANQKEEERVALLSSRVNQIESISTTEIEDRIRDAVFALPRVKDPILTLSSAKNLAIESSLMIDEISFSPGEIRKDFTGSKRAIRLETIRVSFSLQGLEENIRQFVDKAFLRSPLISVTSVDLDFESISGEGAISANISADTFFAPVDTTGFSEKTEVTLQPKEEALYQQVKALEKIGTSPITEGAQFVVFDEDRDPFAPVLEKSSPKEDSQ
ncbi:MAG: hypothetical protein ACOYJ8_01750 [Patescibacteria group bacterium]|jgi:hypothetical protein